MSNIDPQTMTDQQAIRKRIAAFRKLARETQWRSEAYRAKVTIIDLKTRLKELQK